MNELWQEQVRAIGGDALVAVLTEIRDTQVATGERLAAIEQKQDNLLQGFPDGDTEGHRRYHEAVIEWRELRNRMVRAALEKMAATGGMAAIGWLIYALWTVLKMEAKR